MIPSAAAKMLNQKITSPFIRELKQQRRRRLRKRHIKSGLALLQTLSHLFQLVQLAKCWQILLEQNSKRLYQSSGKEKEIKVNILYSRPRKNVKLRTFTLWSCSDGKEMYKKEWCTCKVVVLPSKPTAFFAVLGA